MTEPTRDALHVSPHDALAFLASLIEGYYAGDGGEFGIAREIQPRAVQVMRDVLAANAECVRVRAELEAEVERLREVMHEAAARCREIAGMVGDAHELATEYARHTAIGLDAKARPTPRTDG